MDTSPHPEVAASNATRDAARQSLLMSGFALRLAGAVTLATLLWLGVGWAIQGTGGPSL